MYILDAIIGICFAWFTIDGIRKGFVSQAMAIIGLIAGVWASFKFASLVSNWLSGYIQGSEQILRLVAFVLIFIAVITLMTVIGKLIEVTLKFVLLGWLNKTLGAIFAVLKCALIVSLIVMAFHSLNATFNFVSTEKLSESIFYTPLKNMAFSVFPYLKDLLFWGKQS